MIGFYAQILIYKYVLIYNIKKLATLSSSVMLTWLHKNMTDDILYACVWHTDQQIRMGKIPI